MHAVCWLSPYCLSIRAPTYLRDLTHLIKNGLVRSLEGAQRRAHEGKGDVQIGSCTVRPFAELETKIKAVFKKMPKCEIFDLFDFYYFLCHEVSKGRGLGG